MKRPAIPVIDVPRARRLDRDLYLAGLDAGLTPGQARANVTRCRRGLRRAR